MGEDMRKTLAGRVFAELIFAGALAALAAAVCAAPQTKKSAVRDPELIDAQDYGKIVRQYRGKPLIVTFWATWCEPCRDEYPMLNELAKQYAPQGLRVVGINLDQAGDIILMRRLVARHKAIVPKYLKKAGDEPAFGQTVVPGG